MLPQCFFKSAIKIPIWQRRFKNLFSGIQKIFFFFLEFELELFELELFKFYFVVVVGVPRARQLSPEKSFGNPQKNLFKTRFFMLFSKRR